MTVDRDALIDAAVRAVHETQPEGAFDAADDVWLRSDMSIALDVFVPLIAGYIEDELTRPYKVPGDPESYFTTTDTWNNAVETAAHRIRMLVTASTERI